MSIDKVRLDLTKVSDELQKVNGHQKKVKVEPQKVKVVPQKVKAEPHRLDFDGQRVFFEALRMMSGVYIRRYTLRASCTASSIVSFRPASHAASKSVAGSCARRVATSWS